MTTAAAEGWAHFLGSQLVDAVYERLGEASWPDAYDYRADGMQRLEAQLADQNPSETVRGAKLWRELMQIVGQKKLAAILAAWGAAEIDPSDPGAALRQALLEAHDDPRLRDWWNRSEPVIVLARPDSAFRARTMERNRLSGRAVELAHDDGTMAGKRSIAGGGHAVDFQAEGSDWYLTAVKIHGSRYGYPRAPAEDFHVYLCDRDGNVVRDLSFAYSKFRRAKPRWVNLRVEPTNVPATFMICVGFNPTATKGVHVSSDAQGSGHSHSGLPGRLSSGTGGGDWMIRALVDQPKAANPLVPVE